MTTQQAASAVRFLISQGKDLGEICEIICDHCLAPDTIGGAGIGCDNMTMLIVGLLHGRTKEEWQAWVTDRVKQRYGHYTPLELPRLYSESRIEGNRRRMAAWEERQRYWAEKDKAKNNDVPAGPGTQRVEQAGGITILLRPESLFNTPADEEDEDEDSDSDTPPASDLGLESEFRHDPTEGLKAQLDELDREEEERQAKKHKSDADASSELQGEAPPPPKEANGVPADVQALPPDTQVRI